MDWATKRQLQYIGIAFFVVIIFVVVPFFIFIYKAPTCFDGVKNGEETGVDCGGACKLLCTAQIAEPISRWDPRVFAVGNGAYSVLAYFENPNAAAEVTKAPYSFKLYDAQGVFITERTGFTFIPRGVKFAVFEPNINTGERVPTRATFEFTAPLTWVRNTAASPNLSLTNKALLYASTTPRVEASITNTTLDRVKNVDLISIVYDGAGNAIGASRTYLEALEAEAKQNIVFTWPAPFATKAEVCSEPVDIVLAIDRSGSMAAFGKDPPQPLTDVKNAGIFFINQLSENDYASLVSFSTTATNDSPLASGVKTIVDAADKIAIKFNEGIQQTNIHDALVASQNELASSRHRDGVPGIVVLLTDGVATVPVKAKDSRYPETSAMEVAKDIKAQGIRIFTIGLGKDLNVQFLKDVATSPSDFYSAPSAKDLTGIYTQIATKICKKKPAAIEIIPRINPYSIVF